MTDDSPKFDDVKARLDEIAVEVSADGVSLDKALALYEEAVSLGLAACDLSEKDVLVAPDGDVGAAAAAGDEAVDGEVADVAVNEAADGEVVGDRFAADEVEATVSAGEADDSKDVEDGEDTSDN